MGQVRFWGHFSIFLLCTYVLKSLKFSLPLNNPKPLESRIIKLGGILEVWTQAVGVMANSSHCWKQCCHIKTEKCCLFAKLKFSTLYFQALNSLKFLLPLNNPKPLESRIIGGILWVWTQAVMWWPIAVTIRNNDVISKQKNVTLPSEWDSKSAFTLKECPLATLSFCSIQSGIS